jgi:hypothetical protein
MLSVTFIYCYAEFHVLFIVMLNVLMLSVIMLSVIMLSVVAPLNHPRKQKYKNCCSQEPLFLVMCDPSINEL